MSGGMAGGLRDWALPAATLAQPLRAAALSLPTDDASARIAAAIRVQHLVAALD